MADTGSLVDPKLTTLNSRAIKGYTGSYTKHWVDHPCLCQGNRGARRPQADCYSNPNEGGLGTRWGRGQDVGFIGFGVSGLGSEILKPILTLKVQVPN